MQLFFILIPEKPKTIKEIIKSKFIVSNPLPSDARAPVPVRPKVDR